MKTSISLELGVLAGLSYEETAKTLKKTGFDGIDLDLSHDQSEPEKVLSDEWMKKAVAMAKATKDAGLEIAQSHLPYFPGHLENPGDGSDEAFEAFMLPMYEQGLKACGRTGCKIAVMHPYYHLESKEKTIEGNVRLIRRLLPLMEKYGVQIALENVFGRRNGQYLKAYVSLPETILAIIDGVNSPLVGACIDTGHANIFRLNISDMARMYGSRLIALHVNSNAGHDEHAIPYSISGWCEKLDFHAFSAALREIGYKGFYNLEITGGRFPASVAEPFYAYAGGVARYLADLAL